MKRCSKCGSEKAEECFSRSRATADGRNGWCKACINAWRAANGERLCAYRAANHTRRAAQTKAWKKANSQRVNAHNRRYNAANAERVRAWRARWAAANPDTRAANLAARRARKQGRFVEKVYRSKVLREQGGICGVCGVLVDSEDFHLDHIIPLSRGGEHSYANIQLAHPSCNLRKAASVA